jgi:hypothetical protein
VENGVTLTLGSNVSLRGRNNNADSLVWVSSGGALVMNTGSKISDNSSHPNSTSASGGGVRVYGAFTMNGGTISGNSASPLGGGVRVDEGTFTMNGGTISGNTADSGGGVYVNGNAGTFTKQSGGVIYGPDADDALKNTATSGNGHAASVSQEWIRTGTAGEGVTLDSAVSGATGGWISASDKEISGFSFASPAAEGVISGTDISISVPYGTNLTALVPSIIYSGASVSPESGTAQDFSAPVSYTVSAGDGTTAEYTVTVRQRGAITVIYPRNEAKDALSGGSISIAKPNGTRTLAASGAFDTYRWRVDGVIVGAANTVTLNAADYTTGVHHLSLEVTLDGVVYSKSGAFTVQ